MTPVPVEGRPLDDTELVERARRGDMDAYQMLVQRYRTDAYRVAWVLAGGTTEADDAVQEAWVKAWRSLERFRAGAPFRPWLLRIVGNEARNRRRSLGRRQGLALRAAAAVGDGRPSGNVAPSPEEAVLAGESRAALAAALDLLPEADRAVLSCRFLLQLSEEETAAALGCARGTVKSRTSRALERLRATLGEEAVRG